MRNHSSAQRVHVSTTPCTRLQCNGPTGASAGASTSFDRCQLWEWCQLYTCWHHSDQCHTPRPARHIEVTTHLLLLLGLARAHATSRPEPCAAIHPVTEQSAPPLPHRVAAHDPYSVADQALESAKARTVKQSLLLLDTGGALPRGLICGAADQRHTPCCKCPRACLPQGRPWASPIVAQRAPEVGHGHEGLPH